MWLDNTYIGWFCVLFTELIFITLMVLYCMERNSFSSSHLGRWWKKYIVMLMLILPVIVYGYHFRENDWSSSPSDWGAFGDYIGGVYSVVLTIVLVYVTYTMNRKNDERKECKKAIKDIYKMILELNTSNIDLEQIHKIIRSIDANSLHMSSEMSNKLIREMDYYICVAADMGLIDLAKEEKIKAMLRFYYNES